MTLVVGRIADGDIRIEADSRISDPARARNDPLCGQLKAVIVHPHACICFAGTVEYAERALTEILKGIQDDSVSSDDDAVRVLCNVHEASGGSTDFVLATVASKKPFLYKIANGQVESGAPNFWLGDRDAFEKYQKRFHSLPISSSVADRMRNAFRAVIDDELLTSVGDFHIRTCLDHEPGLGRIFSYEEEIMVTMQEGVTIKGGQGWQRIPMGTVEGGAFGISYLRGMSRVFHAVAAHFPYGRFGVLWCPQVSLERILIEDVDGRAFVDRVLKRYNIPLRGFIKMSATAIQLVDARVAAK